ncbi:MAG: ribonuclease HII [Coriobacteriia bacterium]
MQDRPYPSVPEIQALFSEALSSRELSRLLRVYQDDARLGVQKACEAAAARLNAARAERRRTNGLYQTERQLREQGCFAVAGVDEVGRGALAGPLTVCAIILPEKPLIEGLDDSKRLTPARREVLAEEIRATACAYAVAHTPAAEIDRVGITAALKSAVTRAVSALPVGIDHVLMDGLPLRLFENETAIVKGDSKVAAIAAASIVAKVTRDALMVEYAAEYPEYSFAINKGYSTAEHLAALTEFGPCCLHRRSFSPGGGTISLF